MHVEVLRHQGDPAQLTYFFAASFSGVDDSFIIARPFRVDACMMPNPAAMSRPPITTGDTLAKHRTRLASGCEQ
jgi:hypothetical protein